MRLREGEPSPGAREARRQQQEAEDPDRNYQIGRDREEADNLGDDEKHARAFLRSLIPYFFFHAA